MDVLKQNSFGVSPITEALKLGREDIAAELMKHSSATKLDDGVSAAVGGVTVDEESDSGDDDEDEAASAEP